MNRGGAEPTVTGRRHLNGNERTRSTISQKLVALQFLKCLLHLRAGLLDSLGFFDQPVTLAGVDVDFSLLLVDLRFPGLGSSCFCSMT
jgi:hypothetical protein